MGWGQPAAGDVCSTHTPRSSRCDHPAAVLLFNGSKVASASQLIFLCREDLRVFLRKHPLVKESLIADFGATAAELALD